MSRGQYVQVWHPEAPGVKLLVYRPWWKRKRKPFATLGEAGRATIWARYAQDATAPASAVSPEEEL